MQGRIVSLVLALIFSASTAIAATIPKAGARCTTSLKTFTKAVIDSEKSKR